MDIRLANDLFNLLFRPRRFAASSTIGVREFFQKIFGFFYKSEIIRRQILSRELPQFGMFEIPEKKGFERAVLNSTLLNAALSEAKIILDRTLTPDFLKQNSDRHLISIPVRENLNSANPFIKLALEPKLLKSVTNYLGILPVIENIYIHYSPNAQNLQRSSQEFHLDGQDLRTLQLYVFIEDVGLDSGPLVVVEASKSIEIAKRIGYRKIISQKRVSDDLIKGQVQSGQITAITGAKGDAYIVDTDRCFHYGSRMARLPRKVLVIQYYSPFAFVLPAKWWTKLPYARLPDLNLFSKLEQAVLGAPTQKEFS